MNNKEIKIEEVQIGDVYRDLEHNILVEVVTRPRFNNRHWSWSAKQLDGDLNLTARTINYHISDTEKPQIVYAK